jgi:hypothetical protein
MMSMGEKVQKVLISITVLGAVSTVLFSTVYAQEDQRPKGDIVNSKYLIIRDQKFNNGTFGGLITGTIINNSTQEISLVKAYAILYDKSNQVITVERSIVLLSTLKPGQGSPFEISLFGLGPEKVDHYTLIPGGSLR